MQQSESIAELALALSGAQREMGVAKRTSTNPFYKSKYADFESIVEAYREPLGKYGLSLIYLPSTVGNQICMQTMVLHASGQFILSDTLAVTPKDEGPQAAGMCMSYLKRYQGPAMIGLATTGEDDDAETAEGRKGNGGSTIATPQAKPGATPKPLVTIAPQPGGPQFAPVSIKAPKAAPKETEIKELKVIASFKVLGFDEKDSKSTWKEGEPFGTWHLMKATTITPDGGEIDLSTFDHPQGATLKQSYYTGQLLTATYRVEESKKKPGTFNNVIVTLEQAAEAAAAGQSDLYGRP